MALTLAQAVTQVRSNINESYDGFQELMPNQVDRDFSAASAWANGTDTLDGAYDETTGGVLTITATAGSQYCTLAVASAPTTAGRTYRLYFDVSSIVLTWNVEDYTGAQVLGTISADGTHQYIEFTAATPGGLRLVANSATSSGVFDNFSLIDVSGGFWSDDEIENWIAEGTRVFSSKTLLVQAVSTISPMILATPYYDSVDETFLANILDIQAIIYNISTSYKGLVKIHPRQIGNLVKSAVTGPPKYYCLFEKKLYVFPLASATEVASGTLDVLYSALTGTFTEIKEEYQHLPITYATAKALQKDQKFGQAGVLMQQFYQEISFERSDKYNIEVNTIDDFKIKATAGAQQNARR